MTFKVASVEKHIRRNHPGCPDFAVAFFAAEVAKKSWKGVTLGQAVGITFQTYLRHELTDYDQLLMIGVERREAKRRVQPRINAMLASWSENKI